MKKPILLKALHGVAALAEGIRFGQKEWLFRDGSVACIQDEANINKHPDFFEWVDDEVYWEPKEGEQCFWIDGGEKVYYSSIQDSHDNFTNWKKREHAQKVADAYLELRKKMHKEFYKK